MSGVLSEVSPLCPWSFPLLKDRGIHLTHTSGLGSGVLGCSLRSISVGIQTCYSPTLTGRLPLTSLSHPTRICRPSLPAVRSSVFRTQSLRTLAPLHREQSAMCLVLAVTEVCTDLLVYGPLLSWALLFLSVSSHFIWDFVGIFWGLLWSEVFPERIVTRFFTGWVPSRARSSIEPIQYYTLTILRLK